MSDLSAPSSSSAPQFATAEYASSGSDRCKSCNQPLTSSYFRVNGALACPTCVENLRAQLPKDTHSAFVRGMLFGIGGAILGMILYSAFGIITGIEIGYLALAVGFLVGKAIRMGSGNIGGRRYQIAAAVLTYAAVSFSAIPIGIYEYSKDLKSKGSQIEVVTPAPESSGSASSSSTSEPPEAEAVEKDSASSKGAGGLILTLLFYGFASPILELQNPINGLLGLVILVVGIRYAWSQTGAPKVDILGPFETTTAPVKT